MNYTVWCMFSKHIAAIFFAFASVLIACSPPDYTANDYVRPLSGNFDYGVNMGYFPPYYDDAALAKLARDWGAGSIRPGLFHHFLETWGYESRLHEFRYYDSIGLRNVVAILGFPSPNARDTSCYCPGEPSTVFTGLYTPIWDDGANGTPVNDNNPYALYIWKTGTTYKGLIKIYEVWNEPDFDYGKGMMVPGQPGNWWENAPQACETRLKSPVFHYIRMLRITYEVMKNADPDALIAVGGLGWPAYLDAICRYTDEPVAGRIHDKHYPFRGGAYFDCMSFHSYPHLGCLMQKEMDSPGRMNWKRHSDAATEGLWDLQNNMQKVLEKHGYNHRIYPRKHWICTEFNIPRRQVGDYIGSDTAQVNFLLKALIGARIRGVAQMHIYSLADENNVANPEFSFMGLFNNLQNVPIGQAQPQASAYALKTISTLLDGTVYDSLQTARLRLPETVSGAAFRHADGRITWVLWAKTSLDRIENTPFLYSFPREIETVNLEARYWDYARTLERHRISGRTVRLSGCPVFLSAE